MSGQSYLIGKNNLVQQGGSLQDQLRSMPDKSMKLMNIQRKQKILEDLFSFLLQKRLETSISSASTISNSRVIEPALGSSSPISPGYQENIYCISPDRHFDSGRCNRRKGIVARQSIRPYGRGKKNPGTHPG